MSYGTLLRRYASLIALVVLVGAATSSAFADEPGYQGKKADQTRTQAGAALILGDAAKASDETRTPKDAATPSTEVNDRLKRSRELWARFERYTSGN